MCNLLGNLPVYKVLTEFLFQLMLYVRCLISFHFSDDYDHFIFFLMTLSYSLYSLIYMWWWLWPFFLILFNNLSLFTVWFHFNDDYGHFIFSLMTLAFSLYRTCAPKLYSKTLQLGPITHTQEIFLLEEWIWRNNSDLEGKNVACLVRFLLSTFVDFPLYSSCFPIRCLFS